MKEVLSSVPPEPSELPTVVIPQKTFALVSRSIALTSTESAPAIMDTLLHLSNQITQLTSRLSLLEKTAAGADWKTVPSYHSGRGHE